MDFNNIDWDNVYPNEPVIFKNAVNNAINMINNSNDLLDNDISIVPKKQSTKKRMTLLLVATIIFATLLSGFTFVSILFKERMESMNQDEINDYFTTANSSSIIRYSRNLTNEEINRMNALKYDYENNGIFPLNAISYMAFNDYQGDGISYDIEKDLMCIPDTPLSDEEILEIIDFYEKMNYSIDVISNQADSNNEAIAVLVPNESDSFISIEDFEAYNNSLSYRILNYSDEKTYWHEAANSKYLFLGTNKQISRFNHGETDAEIIFEADETQIILALYADNSYIYVALMSSDRISPSKLLKLSDKGEIITDYNLSDTVDNAGEPLYSHTAYKMMADENGNLYIKFRDYNEEGTLAFVFDNNGQCVGKINSEKYTSDDWQPMCIDENDNLLIFAHNASDLDHLVLLTIDTTTLNINTVKEIQSNDTTIQFDAARLSCNDNLYIVGYDGLSHISSGSDCIENDIHGYDEKWFNEGARFTFADSETLIILRPGYEYDDGSSSETSVIYVKY